MSGEKAGLDRIGSLCAEAVREHGTDYRAVRAYVDARLAALSASDRLALKREVESSLQDEALPPDRSATRH